MLRSVLRRLVRELTEELVRHYSPTFHEGEAIEALRRFCIERLGFSEVFTDGVGNLIAKYGSGNVKVALIGHIDTVPGKLPVVVSNELIRGRGAVDAKGPLASAFVGAYLSRELIDDSEVTVYAIALVGEEGPSHGAWELVRSGFKVDAAVICEPSRASDVVIEYRGSALISISCGAPPTHSANPDRHESACDKLINAWLGISKSLSNYSIISTLMKLSCGELSNVTPTFGTSLISLRVPVGIERNFITDLLSKYLPKNCTYELSSYLPPVRVSPNSVGVRALVRALIKLGIKPKLARKYGTSDMNIIYGRVSENVVSYGPGDPKLSHTSNEYVSIDELELASKVYALFIKEVTDLIKKRRLCSK